jgi:hypothetical protein
MFGQDIQVNVHKIIIYKMLENKEVYFWTSYTLRRLPTVVKLNHSHINLQFTISSNTTSGHEIMPGNDLGLKYMSI